VPDQCSNEMMVADDVKPVNQFLRTFASLYQQQPSTRKKGITQEEENTNLRQSISGKIQTVNGNATSENT
jgi:hypothetical protein